MHKALRDHKSLLRPQIHRAIFKIDNKMALQDNEELVVAIVFVPVILTLHHPQANNRIVHFAQRLVVPLVIAGFHQRRNVHQSQPGNLMSRNVAYGYDFVSFIKVCVQGEVRWESEIFHL